MSRYDGISFTSDEEIDHINNEIKLLLKRKMNITSDQGICNNENISENINALSEELGLLGINIDISENTETDNIVSLCNAMWPLLHRYKRLNEKWMNCDMNIKRIHQDNESLIKSTASLKNEIDDKNYHVTSLKAARLKLTAELELANKEIIQLKSTLEKQRKQQLSKEVQRQKEVKRSEVQLNNLQDKFRGQCGQYTSRDKTEGKHILEFKKKEEMYKQTINKLEGNERELLHEILSLKEEIVIQTYEGNIHK